MWEEKWAEFEGGWGWGGGEDSKMTILQALIYFKALDRDIRSNCCTACTT